MACAYAGAGWCATALQLRVEEERGDAERHVAHAHDAHHARVPQPVQALTQAQRGQQHHHHADPQLST